MAFKPVPLEPRQPKVPPQPVPLVGEGALPPRREAFCRHVVDGLSPPVAARLAGFPWGRALGCAAALLAEPEVSARIVEIAEASRGQRRTLRAMLMSRLLRVLDAALAAGDRADALRAIRVAQGFKPEGEPIESLLEQWKMDDRVGGLASAAPVDPADLAEDGTVPAMPPLPHTHVALHGPLDSPEHLEGVSDLLKEARAWLPVIKDRSQTAGAVLDLLLANDRRLPDDFDLRDFPWGVEDWYRDELIERRRAQGRDPVDGGPLRTPTQ